VRVSKTEAAAALSPTSETVQCPVCTKKVHDLEEHARAQTKKRGPRGKDHEGHLAIVRRALEESPEVLALREKWEETLLKDIILLAKGRIQLGMHLAKAGFGAVWLVVLLAAGVAASLSRLNVRA
jgi:hypothetical protein